jgi:predicted HicB family RNase H-like nuclease
MSDRTRARRDQSTGAAAARQPRIVTQGQTVVNTPPSFETNEQREAIQTRQAEIVERAATDQQATIEQARSAAETAVEQQREFQEADAGRRADAEAKFNKRVEEEVERRLATQLATGTVSPASAAQVINEARTQMGATGVPLDRAVTQDQRTGTLTEQFGAKGSIGVVNSAEGDAPKSDDKKAAPDASGETSNG